MLQPMNGLQYAQSGFNLMANDMAARQTAVKLFDKVYSSAQRKKLFSGLWGRSRNLQHLQAETLPTNSHYSGTRIVNVDMIRGTESRGDEFDADFLPTEEHVEQRWVSVATAMLIDVTLPPVDLLKVGNNYYVRDGHHRISVARALGIKSIDAVVTEHTD